MGETPPTVKKRHSMRRKEVTELLEEANNTIGRLEADRVESGEFEDGSTVYFLDGEIQLVRDEKGLWPTLKCECIDELPAIIVDMGAVPYLCNGADVMAPGITAVKSSFKEGAIVVVRDIKHNKPLVVGRALKASEEIEGSKRGKMIRNLHYVGDKIWDSIS